MIKLRWIGGIAIAVVLIMSWTCPSENDFDNWISSQGRIKCRDNDCVKLVSTVTSDGHLTTRLDKLEWSSTSKRTLGVLMKIEKRFEDPDGDEVTIRAVGLLGGFIRL